MLHSGKWMRFLAFFVLVHGTGFVNLDVRAQAYDFNPVKQRIQSELIRKGIPSISVAVAKDGKIIWEEGFGWADREKRIPATEHTIYTLASVAKPVTATGLMVLVERGQVDLDKPANDYLGESKLRAKVGDAAQATVRRVANHTSGLPGWYNFFLDNEPIRRPPMDQTILRYGYLMWEPGTYRYSNLGYGVLDYLIERVSGKSFVDFMRSEVFIPLGMTHSSVFITPALEDYKAIRYGRDGTPLPFFDTDNRGGGAIYSSAHDMVRFGMFMLKNRLPDQKPILSDKMIDEMIRPTAEIASDRRIGIAWQLATTNKGIPIVEHWGAMPGSTTGFTFVPQANAAMVILSNGDRVSVTRVRDLILEALRLANPPPPDDETANGSSGKDLRPPAQFVATWKGSIATYQGDVPLTLVIREDGDVHAQLGRELPTLLSQVSFEDDGIANGTMIGTIDTEDVKQRSYPHLLILRVKLRGDVLGGEAQSFSLAGEGNGRLAYWVELRKQEAPKL